MKISKLRSSLMFLILFFSISCIGRNSSSNTKTDIKDTTIKSRIVNKVLEEEIRNSIQYLNERDSEATPVNTLFDVIFLNQSNDCYIVIAPDVRYLKEYVYGYTYVDDYIILFNKKDSLCSAGWVDWTKLIPFKDTIPGFVDYSKLLDLAYDPFGMKFKVAGVDSLVLVYKGGL